MPFLTELHVKPAGKGRFELTKDLDYLTPQQMLIRIPKGFVTDFASIPWLFQIAFKKNGNHREEAVFHDYLYSVGGYSMGERKDGAFVSQSRAQCDWRFYISMLESTGSDHERDISNATAKLMYRAVRWFGGFAWNEHRKNKNRVIK